jgi:hypothetical protein
MASRHERVNGAKGVTASAQRPAMPLTVPASLDKMRDA